MGQYWKLINLDKRETYGFWGKLGEFFFDGSPGCLNQTLRIPSTLLPECDKLLFPFKPGALCNEADEFLNCRATYFPQTAVQSSALVNFPTELIQEIYHEAENIRDVVCLSVTCQALWDVGRHEIYRRLGLLIAAVSWAGDRIICVGDYLENDDIPSHILTLAEKEEFTGQRPAPDEDDDEFEYSERHYTLYSYPFCEIPYERAALNMGRFLIRLELPFGGCNALCPLVDLSFTTTQPTKPAMAILRNLSRHQYVRESVLARWHAHSGKTGFGEIVLSRICCSSDPSASMGYKGGIHRGVWAGDRFDIMSSEWLEGLDNGDGLWTDVSEEVLAEISLIWASG
ncbi:hypothetical protein C8R45DRAFT_1213555 [Mycena sanguinolenta]|nr:hypothetical protein C8R45DRAFT_1213555 [Mycena sanguinolenta]